MKDLNLGAAVAGGVVGYRMGSEVRDIMRANAEAAEEQNTIRQWEQYSNGLEQQLREAKLQLANANTKVESLGGVIEEIKEIALDYAAKVEDRENTIEQQDQELEVLRAKELKRKELEEAHAKHRAFLEAQNERLKHACEHNSSQAAAYQGLFRLLADEMARSEDIEQFSVLNPDFIQKAYQRAYAGFAKTGKIDYQPDLDPADVVRVGSRRSRAAP